MGIGIVMTIIMQSSNAAVATTLTALHTGAINFEQAAALEEQQGQERPAVLQQTAGGQGGPAKALEILDAMRWPDRMGYHAWRICHYLGGDGQTAPAPTD